MHAHARLNYAGKSTSLRPLMGEGGLKLEKFQKESGISRIEILNACLRAYG